MSDLLRTAIDAARASGSLLLERFREPAKGVQSKTTGTDLVSDADKDSESLILSILRADRPDDAVLTEEAGSFNGTSGVRWIIDPLDGTVNFLHGIPQWCTSIACEDGDGMLVGVVHDACRNETFTAERGAGAFLNDVPISCSGLTDLSRAMVGTGFGYLPAERLAWGAIVHALLPQVADIRRAGSAALDLAWTACGRVDVYAEIPCRPWDRAAGMLIATEAGCEASLLDALGPSGEGVVCAPPALYERVRSMISAARS